MECLSAVYDKIWQSTHGHLSLLAGFIFVMVEEKRPEMIWLAVNFIAIAGIINPVIKLFVMRVRPTLEHLVVEHSYSFPSGHAAGSMIYMVH